MSGEQRGIPMSRFVLALWHGRRGLRRAFLHDMLLVGTLVNATTFMLTLMSVTMKMDSWVSIAMFLLPLPYNLLLLRSVWTSANQSSHPHAISIKLAAMAWTSLLTLV